MTAKDIHQAHYQLAAHEGQQNRTRERTNGIVDLLLSDCGRAFFENPRRHSISKDSRALNHPCSPKPHTKPQGNTILTPTTVESEQIDGSIRVPSGSGFRVMTPFPWRLHEMLEDVERKGMTSVVSWLPDGSAFQVHSPEQFADLVVPKYFRHTRYKSFQRQLYLYGFRSYETSSVSRGAYFHPSFVRGNRSLCRQITRQKVAKDSSLQGDARKGSSKQHKRANTESKLGLELPGKGSTASARKAPEHHQGSCDKFDSLCMSLDVDHDSCGKFLDKVREDCPRNSTEVLSWQHTAASPSLFQNFHLAMLNKPAIVSPVHSSRVANMLYWDKENLELDDHNLPSSDNLLTMKKLEPFSEEIISLFGTAATC